MASAQNEKQFLSMFLVLISFFILIFFTKWAYSDLIINMETRDQLEIEKMEKESEVTKLNKQKKTIEKAWEAWVGDNQRFNHQLNEGEILENLYEYSDNYERWSMNILSISITEWTKTESGFNSSNISLSVRVSNSSVMMDLIEHIINNDTFKFYIESFNLPEESNEGGFTVNIPITMLYKEFKASPKEKQ